MKRHGAPPSSTQTSPIDAAVLILARLLAHLTVAEAARASQTEEVFPEDGKSQKDQPQN
jgi:hypothetical protein